MGIQLFFNIIQCIAAVATAISLVFIIKQTQATEKTYKYTCAWQERNKAVELSEYYKNNILSTISYITIVLEKAGVVEKLSNVRNADIKDFSEDELFGLTNRNIMGEIDKLLISEQSVAIIYFLRKKYANIFNIQAAKLSAIKGSEDDPAGMTEIIRANANELRVEFSGVVSDVLNSLEYFAMNFISGVADDTIVFQSLHQTYFRIVRALYYRIASQNRHPKDKFYTNIIALYHKWNEMDIKNGKLSEIAIPTTTAIKK